MAKLRMIIFHRQDLELVDKSMKTQTRRISPSQEHEPAAFCPYGEVGDILLAHRPEAPSWALQVRLVITEVRQERLQRISAADCSAEGITVYRAGSGVMPAGINTVVDDQYRANFRKQWDAVYAGRGFGWDSDPLVWAITFRKVEG